MLKLYEDKMIWEFQGATYSSDLCTSFKYFPLDPGRHETQVKQRTKPHIFLFSIFPLA